MAVYRERLVYGKGGDPLPIREVRMFSFFGWEWWRQVENLMSPAFEARIKALEAYATMDSHLEDAEAATKAAKQIVARIESLGSPAQGVGPSYKVSGYAWLVRSKRETPNPGPAWDELRKFLKKGGGKIHRSSSTDYVPQDSQAARKSWVEKGQKTGDHSTLVGFHDPLKPGGNQQRGNKGGNNQQGKGNQQQQPDYQKEGLSDSDIDKEIEGIYPAGVPVK